MTLMGYLDPRARATTSGPMSIRRGPSFYRSFAADDAGPVVDHFQRPVRAGATRVDAADGPWGYAVCMARLGEVSTFQNGVLDCIEVHPPP